MSDHDPIGDLLRAGARRAGEPPADLAARCLRRVQDQRRLRRLRVVMGTALAAAAAAGLTIALLRPTPPPAAPASLATGPAPLPAPLAPSAVEPTVPVAATERAADLRRILARTTYGGERQAILQDLDGCRAFLLACVPRIELAPEASPADEHPTNGL